MDTSSRPIIPITVVAVTSPIDWLTIREKIRDVILVKIDGDPGHDLEEFGAKHLDMPRRLIRQDRPEVILEVTRINAKVELTAHIILCLLISQR
jgi:hypothetical protein